MRLYTIWLVATLALVILTAPLAAEAQQATKVYRIGRLSPGSPLLVAHLWEAFRQGLRELAMWRARTSSLSTAMRKGVRSGCATSQPNWSGSRWT